MAGFVQPQEVDLKVGTSLKCELCAENRPFFLVTCSVCGSLYCWSKYRDQNGNHHGHWLKHKTNGRVCNGRNGDGHYTSVLFQAKTLLPESLFEDGERYFNPDEESAKVLLQLHSEGGRFPLPDVVHWVYEKHPLEEYEVAIDLGATYTKWGIRKAKSSVWLRTGHMERDRAKDFWGGSSVKFMERVEAFVMQHIEGNFTDVSAVGFSLSGDVNHDDQVCTLSYALQEFWGVGCIFRASDFGGKCSIANDGVAAAIGAVLKEDGTLPSLFRPKLIITLGTGVAVVVAERWQNQPLKLYSLQELLQAKFSSSSGETVMVGSYPGGIGKLHELEERNRRSRRVGRALAAMLISYHEIFKWDPEQVIFLGGNSVDLDIDEIRAGSKTPRVDGKRCVDTERLTIIVPHSFESQRTIHLNGAIAFGRERKNVIVLTKL